ncbi:unnamed protein product [Rhizoctonia solani]|uniref:Uncharacterized protein n=1 Tax=Rhizoctonia solani TaxID=456999 RepID=A0A8H3E5H9_9AGAM|nr:unnamed protein product [Rhizoctonia solani]
MTGISDHWDTHVVHRCEGTTGDSGTVAPTGSLAMSEESRNGSESTDPSGEATLVNSPIATRQMPTGERDRRDVNGSNSTASPTTGMSKLE